MSVIAFIILCSVYVLCLALVDGLFNRLVFRANRKLSYNSPEKSEIYQMPEWRYIGVFFLILLPIVIPIIVSYYIGGLSYVSHYLIVALLIPWDIIFGKLVFDDWVGDTPSIALPFIGWLSLDLKVVILLRLILVIALFSWI